MYYLDWDGAIVPATLETLPKDVPSSRVFASVIGASLHPDAVPVTAVNIKTEEAYDSREVMDNNWSVNGLTPIGLYTVVTIEKERREPCETYQYTTQTKAAVRPTYERLPYLG